MSASTVIKLYRLTLAALVASSLVLHLAILWASRHRLAEGYGDFIIFYTGAQIINDGKSKELFNVKTQNAYQAKFDVPQLEWPLPFNHAPYELFLFLPLAHLPYAAAHAIWSGLNLVLLAIMLQWCLSYVKSSYSIFIVASVIAWFPTLETFRLGQDSILSTALLLAVFVALKRERDGWAGFFLALGLYKPQLVVPMADVFLVVRRWRTFVVFLITGTALLIVSLAMVGRRGAYDFASILSLMDRYSFVIRPALMPNLRGLTAVLIERGNFELISLTMIIAVSLGLYALCMYLLDKNFGRAQPG